MALRPREQGVASAAPAVQIPRREEPARKDTTMPRATWKGAVLAESDAHEIVEGNVYFPASALRADHFRPSDTHTVCPWKGVASYYDVVVGDEVNKDAAWYYPEPKDAAANIRGHVAFWKGVTVER
jgi:uncharacterized protein (DUF427 family)